MEYSAYYYMYSNVFPYPAIQKVNGYNTYLRLYGMKTEPTIILTVLIKNGTITQMQSGAFVGTFSVYYR
jgi:hypothetical protein